MTLKTVDVPEAESCATGVLVIEYCVKVDNGRDDVAPFAGARYT